MIREIYPSGFNSFVTPFMLGMLFVLGWCLVGAFRVLLELPKEDRKKLALSFLSPRIMLKNIGDWFFDCLFHLTTMAFPFRFSLTSLVPRGTIL